MTNYEPVLAATTRTDAKSAPRQKPSTEQIDQWADLVAAGEISFPADLEPNEIEQLLLEIADRRRKRFMRFIADAIAQDIARLTNTLDGDSDDVEAHV